MAILHSVVVNVSVDVPDSAIGQPATITVSGIAYAGRSKSFLKTKNTRALILFVEPQLPVATLSASCTVRIGTTNYSGTVNQFTVDLAHIHQVSLAGSSGPSQ